MSTQDINFIAVDEIRLSRTDAGDTIATINGVRFEIGQIMSVFPISNKNHFISLRDDSGTEIGIIEHASKLDSESKRIVKEELERSYFLPRITAVIGIEDQLNLFIFSVETDHGFRTFEVRNPRQNVRSVGGGRYIIRDVDGNRYDIPKLRNLGLKSQHLLSEFV